MEINKSLRILHWDNLQKYWNRRAEYRGCTQQAVAARFAPQRDEIPVELAYLLTGTRTTEERRVGVDIFRCSDRVVSMATGPSEAKDVARRYVEVVWNEGDTEEMDEVLTDHQVYHDPTGDGEEPLSEFKEFIQGYHQAFPDLQLDVDRYIAEGDFVAFWGRATGTHEGPFMGIEPTGNHVDIMGINVVRVENGKIAERWANFDIFGMLQQLGHDPLPA